MLFCVCSNHTNSHQKFIVLLLSTDRSRCKILARKIWHVIPLKCNQGISEINNNAVEFSESQLERVGSPLKYSNTGHVALFSSCSPLIFFHADKTIELAAAIILTGNDFARLTYRFNLPQSTTRDFCEGHQGRFF